MISVAEYTSFVTSLGSEYYQNDTNFRVGQAFINRYNDLIRDQLPDPGLYYQMHPNIAFEMIRDRYVDWETEGE
jgi:hypothetical protein